MYSSPFILGKNQEVQIFQGQLFSRNINGKTVQLFTVTSMLSGSTLNVFLGLEYKEPNHNHLWEQKKSHEPENAQNITSGIYIFGLFYSCLCVATIGLAFLELTAI